MKEGLVFFDNLNTEQPGETGTRVETHDDATIEYCNQVCSGGQVCYSTRALDSCTKLLVKLWVQSLVYKQSTMSPVISSNKSCKGWLVLCLLSLAALASSLFEFGFNNVPRTN